jgi:cytochrome b6-f complex iron-sulfur subunit
MSTAAVIALAIGIVVVLGAIAFFTLARRSDVRGAGALSGETVHRDKAARKSAEPAVARASGAEVEAAARSAEIVPVVQPEIVAWTPPDPEAIGVSRRQFFNRATVTLMSAGLGAFGRSLPRSFGAFSGASMSR